jgi:hypothetical protein
MKVPLLDFIPLETTVHLQIWRAISPLGPGRRHHHPKHDFPQHSGPVRVHPMRALIADLHQPGAADALPLGTLGGRLHGLLLEHPIRMDKERTERPQRGTRDPRHPIRMRLAVGLRRGTPTLQLLRTPTLQANLRVLGAAQRLAGQHGAARHQEDHRDQLHSIPQDLRLVGVLRLEIGLVVQKEFGYVLILFFQECP